MLIDLVQVKIGTLFGVDDLEMLASTSSTWSKVGANHGSEMVKHRRSQDKTSQSSIYQESSINPENHMLVQNLSAQNTNPELSHGVNMKFRTFSS